MHKLLILTTKISFRVLFNILGICLCKKNVGDEFCKPFLICGCILVQVLHFFVLLIMMNYSKFEFYLAKIFYRFGQVTWYYMCLNFCALWDPYLVEMLQYSPLFSLDIYQPFLLLAYLNISFCSRTSASRCISQW